MSNAPLVTKSYVDRQVEAVRDNALRVAEDVSRQLRELSTSLGEHVSVVATRADEGGRLAESVGSDVERLRGAVEELVEQASWTRERIDAARDAADVSDLRELVKELGERVEQVEKKAQPVIETLGRLGPGGGFFSAKPGVDMVPVGDANGQWSLVDKDTLGGGGGGGAPTGADYLVGTAQAGLSAEIVVGATPGGELGGTWGAPTVDAVHSGSSHAATKDAAEAAAAAALAAHTGDATDAHDASAISNVAAGGIAATDVQAALNELDAEKAAASHAHAGEDITSGTVADARIASTITRDSELATHEADTLDVHGVADTSALYRSGGTDVAVTDGGTGASTAAGARTNLDVPSNVEAILDAIVDAKGDLIVGTAADTVARLASSGATDGHVLTKDAAEATGLKWAAGGGGVVAAAAKVRHSVDQSIAAGGTILAFDTEIFDNDTIHDTVTNNSRLTCRTAGRYVVGAAFAWSGAPGSGDNMEILLNGTTIVHEVGALAFGALLGTVVDLAVNDYLQVRVFNSTGAARNALAISPYSPTFWMTLVGPSSAAAAVQPAARVFHSATQAVANATDVVLTFDSERWDTDGIHDPAVNPTRLTCRTTGKYSIKANVEWPSNGTGVRQLMINVNGAASGTELARIQDDSAGSTVTTRQVITCDVDLVVGDYVELIARQTSTVSLTIPASTGYQCEFSMHRFSPSGDAGADAILDSIVDAKGDLIVGTAADTIARQPVGSTGHVLAVDPAEVTGVKWVGGMTLIEAKVLAADAATMSFASIPSTFSHLLIEYSLRSTLAATIAFVDLQFNGDTGANYDDQTSTASAAALAAAERFGQTVAHAGVLVAASGGASLFSHGVIEVPNYASTAFHKALLGRVSVKHGTSSGNLSIWTIAGFWRSTAAISSFVLLPQGGGNFLAGCRVSLYGVS